MVAQEACSRAFGLGFGQELLLVGAVAFATSVLLYLAGRWRPGSPQRVAAAAVATAVNVVLPVLFCRWEDTTTIVLLSFNFMWLSSLKAISWAFNRGALVTQPYNFLQFLVVYAAPVDPVASAAAATDAAGKPAVAPTSNGGSAASVRKGRLTEDAGDMVTMLRIWATKGVVLACTVQLLQYPWLTGFLESFCLAAMVMALLSMILDGAAAAVVGLIGLRVSPHFDKPWTAKSVAAFWNKHWDLAAGNTLRQLVYDSVCDGSLLPPTKPQGRPSHIRQVLGSLATFVASGLLHECLFWHVTGHTTYGVWSAYFLLQAPAIILERLVLTQLKRHKIMVPGLLRMACTVGGEVLLAQYLFFGPVKKYGVSDSLVHNMGETVTNMGRQLSALTHLAWARALHFPAQAS